MKMQPQTTIAAIAKAKITSWICCIVVFSMRHTTGAPYLRSYATVLAILRCSPQSAAPHYLVPQFWPGDYGATTAGCVRPLSLMTVDQGLLAMLFVKRCTDILFPVPKGCHLPRQTSPLGAFFFASLLWINPISIRLP